MPSRPTHTRIKWGAFSLVLLLAVSASWQLLKEKSNERTSTFQADQTTSFTAARGIKNDRTISSHEAAAIALNRISESDTGLLLNHPRHQAIFDESGITFTPKTGGSSWHWQLNDTNSAGATPVQVEDAIEYHRGIITEQYIPRTQAVEQRFVLSEKPDLTGDLVISGKVACEGQLERYPAGWLWRAADGNVVSLGGVKVFDADGDVLLAHMTVTEDSTEITVDADALAMASYPVTIDPEIGTNDFRISHSLDDFARHFDAISPDVVFNSNHNEFFVVWRADGTAGNQEEFEFEIIGQRIDASTGQLLGTIQMVISTTYEDGETNEGRPATPAVAYNDADDEYLVVWFDDRQEISGQRLNGADGSEIGSDFQISDLNGGNSRNPDIAFSSEWQHYLVVWEAITTRDDLNSGENEIYGQLISRTGAAIGSNDFRISSMGPDGDSSYDAANAAVAYNSTDDVFLVAWESDTDSGGVVNGEFEIFGQLLSGETATEIGSNDFRISDMGNNGSTSADASAPDVAFDSINNQFIVVWHGDNNAAPLATSETEIYGQLLSGALGQEIGTNDFRISQFGNDDGDSDDSASRASVCFVASQGTYVVSWLAAEQLGVGTNRETEAFAQVIAAGSGNAVGPTLKISDMGPDGDDNYAPLSATIAATNGSDLVVCWSSDDDSFELLEGEHEIFGQLATVSASGLTEIQANDFRISEAGNDGDNISDAFMPAIAYNSADNTYLVVWEQDTLGNTGSEEHIAANRISASSGARLHPDDLQVSQSTSAGSIKENFSPTVTYNSTHNEFLIIYSGNSRRDDVFSGIETEIIVRRMEGGTGAFASDEFRISAMGIAGSSRAVPDHAACAYNPLNDQYLVVWESDDDSALVNGEYEIFGQRLNGSDAAPIGDDDFRISFTRADGDADRDAFRPTIAQAGNTYLVAWHADAGSIDDKNEIYAVRIAADTGMQLAPATKISQTGSILNALFTAENPTATADPSTGDFLIAWQADKSFDGGYQIYGEFIRAGAGATPNDFAISNTTGFLGINPAASYNPVLSEFIVAWESLPTGTFGREEIRAQRLSPIDGDEIGLDDFLLSDMGPEGSSAFGAHTPAVGVNTSDGSLLTAWSGDDDENGRIDDEFEIFGQLYSDIPDFKITAIAQAGNTVIINFLSEEGVIYSLQESTDLKAWIDAGAGQVTGTGGIDELIDPNGNIGAVRRIYRVIR